MFLFLGLFIYQTTQTRKAQTLAYRMRKRMRNFKKSVQAGTTAYKGAMKPTVVIAQPKKQATVSYSNMPPTMW